MRKEVSINPSTFCIYSNKPMILMEDQGYSFYTNNLKRKLTSSEILKYNINSVAIIAGTEKYSSDVLKKFKNLKVISRLGTGMDNIDIDLANKMGIKIFKTKTTPAPAVAELVLGMMLNLTRHIQRSSLSLKNGIWNKEMGSLLRNKTLGIIGLGTIGREVVKICKGLNLNIIAFDKYKDKSFSKKYNVNYNDLNILLKKSDIISIHLNLSNDTCNLIDKNKLRIMKPNSIIINTSRGEIIDEQALFAALNKNQLAGAALDVFKNEPYDGPLTELDNVLLTPHIGSYAREIRMKMEMEAAENLIRGLNER